MPFISKAFWKEKKDVRDYYNAIVTSYDALYQQEQSKKYKAALQKLDSSNNGMILDVGCGTGFFFRHISQQFPAMIGVDISIKLLKQAMRRFKFSKTIHFVCCDADYLPLCERTFDKIFSFTLLQNMPQPQKTISEIVKVAKQNAVIVVTGQKKFFTKQIFLSMLQKSKVTILDIFEKNLNDYVVICKKQKE